MVEDSCIDPMLQAAYNPSEYLLHTFGAVAQYRFERCLLILVSPM